MENRKFLMPSWGSMPHIVRSPCLGRFAKCGSRIQQSPNIDGSFLSELKISAHVLCHHTNGMF